MSNIMTNVKSDIRRSTKSSIFQAYHPGELYKLLDDAAKQYLKAKSRRDEAAKNVDRSRQRLVKLLRGLSVELGLQEEQ